MLNNPYYIGVVAYRGVHSEGQHQRLVEPDVGYESRTYWPRTPRRGRRPEAPALFEGADLLRRLRAKVVLHPEPGEGGTYEYFFCLAGRSTHGGTGCRLPYSASSTSNAVERTTTASSST